MTATSEITKNSRVRNTISGQTGTVVGEYENPGFGHAPSVKVLTDSGETCHYLRDEGALAVIAS